MIINKLKDYICIHSLKMSNNAQTNRPSGKKNRESAIKYVVASVIDCFLLLKLPETIQKVLRSLVIWYLFVF